MSGFWQAGEHGGSAISMRTGRPGNEGIKANEADKEMKETKEMKGMCWPSAQAEGSRRRRCKPRSLHSKLRVFRYLAEVK